MLVSVDTNTMKATIDEKIYNLVAEKKLENLADIIEQWIGAKEWDETVTTIQKWFYNGVMRKTAWCATTVSYTANIANKLSLIGGKADNCDVMKENMIRLNHLDATKNHGGGAYKAKRGDIAFLSSKNTLADVTHVGIVSSINHQTGELVVTSGNSQNSIRKDSYNYLNDKKVVAFGRID